MSSEISPSLSPRKAVVTGASSGIGAAFAERFARDGYNLVLVARRQKQLEELAGRLKERHHTDSQVLSADLTDSQELESVVGQIAEEPLLDILVNSAGFIHFSTLAEQDKELTRSMIDLHTIALTQLTQAVLPGMIERQRGTIINVSSIAALFPGQRQYSPNFIATYAATKLFVIALTCGLHDEVKEHGIRVQALCPGYTRSELFERAGAGPMPEDLTMPADILVDASLKGLSLGEVICIPGLEDAHLLTKLAEVQDAISAQAMSTGIPARRYRE